MKNNYFILLVLISFFAKAQTAITLSNSNMPGSGDTLRYSNTTLSSLGSYTQTGTNFTWDFSNAVPTGQGVRNFKSALLTPYSFFFLNINDYGEKIADTINAGIVKITNYYNFYKKSSTPNAYQVVGAGVTMSAVPVPAYYSNPDELYVFPLTYSNYDSTTFKFSTPTTTALPLVYSKTGYRITQVDGWGTITTPYGTANCIRLITTQYSQDSVKFNTFPVKLGFPNYQRSYQWLTTTSKIPYLEITGALTGSSFNPTTIRYRDSYRTFAGINEVIAENNIALYPNPVKDKLYFKNIKNADIEVLDLSGKQLLSIKNNTDESIDVNALTVGIYVLKISTLNNVSQLKFVKTN
ncbi:MAG: T9SS type A sorting domain-containing protein [Bacteroidetes bacterium]|nr:T9SS type A sorting domain-containing protein [Bacteroidota bacterium]